MKKYKSKLRWSSMRLANETTGQTFITREFHVNPKTKIAVAYDILSFRYTTTLYFSLQKNLKISYPLDTTH